MFESFSDLASILNAINVDEEIVASSDSGRHKANCAISLSNTTWNNAGKAPSEIAIQVHSTDASDVSELVSENHILRHHRSGDTSSIVCLSWIIFE